MEGAEMCSWQQREHFCPPPTQAETTALLKVTRSYQNVIPRLLYKVQCNEVNNTWR